jgi:hypothetical protein
VVRVSIEVRNGVASCNVAVRAESIRQAVSLVEKRYHGDVSARFPVDPEGFFVNDPAARAGMAGFEGPDGIAA